MNHQRLKSALSKFTELIKTDNEAAKSQMGEAGYTPEEVEKIIAAANDPGTGTPDPAKADKAPKADKPKKKADEEAGESQKPGHSIYSEWKVSVKRVKNDKGELEWEFKQTEHIKDVKISKSQADLLNKQSHNNNVRYYEKEEA